MENVLSHISHQLSYRVVKMRYPGNNVSSFFCEVKWTSITGILPRGQQAMIIVNKTGSRRNFFCQCRLVKPCPESTLFGYSSSSLSGGLCLILLCFLINWKIKMKLCVLSLTFANKLKFFSGTNEKILTERESRNSIRYYEVSCYTTSSARL